MYLVDVHAHLDHKEFAEDLDEVIKRAKARGIVKIIAQGVNHESNKKVIEIARKYDIVEAALGLYPSEMMSVQLAEGHDRETAFSEETTLAFIEEHADEIVALGEVGLDGKESEDLAQQIVWFRKVVRLAKKLRKPLIIHSRKAEKEVLDVLEEEGCTRAVLHCFMGSKKLVQRAVEKKLYFSIPTALVRNQQFQDNVALIPIGQMLTETDAPYMGPMRDLRNEPGNIKDMIATIAQIKRMDAEEVANSIYFNYQKLFQ